MTDLVPRFWLLFAATSSLLMAVSVPLVRGKVRPNPIYGVRTARTLGDEATWYRVNALGGRLLLLAGLIGLVAATGFCFVPALRADFLAYNLATGTVLIGAILVAVVQTLRQT